MMRILAVAMAICGLALTAEKVYAVDVSVKPIVKLLPPRAGAEVVIDLSDTESNMIRDAKGLEAVGGVIGSQFGPIPGVVVAGAVYALKGEIGQKNKGNGVSIKVEYLVVPVLMQGGISVHSR
jgi:uncharacterized protein YcfJ